jgi:hypothetical protein
MRARSAILGLCVLVIAAAGCGGSSAKAQSPSAKTAVESGHWFSKLEAANVPRGWMDFPPEGFLVLHSGTVTFMSGYASTDRSTWIREVIWSFKSAAAAQSALASYASNVGDLQPVTFPALGNDSLAYSLGDTTGLVGGGALLYTVLVREGQALCVLSASDRPTLKRAPCARAGHDQKPGPHHDGQGRW